MADKLRKMAKAFESIGVSQEMIEKKLGHKLDATLQTETVTMGKIYKSLQDGMSKISDWFETPEVNAAKEEELTNKYKQTPKPGVESKSQEAPSVQG